ncbi:hypothetical protein AGMMS4956_10180 [Bacteroidia bacterium]|nr:hypothetical protein AGMMS4956_10180 [Bacteroidia bacterium]
MTINKLIICIGCLFCGQILFSVNATTAQTIDFEPDFGTQEIEEIVISSRAKDDNITSTRMGVEQLNIKEIQRLPMLMGEVDILKAIQLLPGVQATAEGTSGFSVRGGAPDQNLILLDNSTVYNASHLLGFFSVFNNDVVSGMELYKGDMPLKFGGRLASLLSVETKSDMPQGFEGTGGIGLISSRLMLEGPAGERTSWMIGGRRSYIDLFFGLSGTEMIQNAILHFYDLNAKISHRVSDKDRIEINAYYGKDAFGAEMGKFDYGNTAASLLWKHRFLEQLFSTFSVHLSDYKYRFGAALGEMEVDWRAGIFDVALKADFNHHVNRWLNLNYGVSSIVHRLNPGNINISGYGGYDMQRNESLEHGIYLSNEHNMTDKLSFRYGLRWSVFQNLGGLTTYSYDSNYEVADSIYYKTGTIYNTYGQLEPRVGVVYLINKHSSVKANYARNAQFIQLAENSASGSPLNVWFAASPNIKPQTVDNFSVGYFQNFNNNMYETSVETYYKNMKNVIDFGEHAELLMNQQLEGEVRTGTGRACDYMLSVEVDFNNDGIKEIYTAASFMHVPIEIDSVAIRSLYMMGQKGYYNFILQCQDEKEGGSSFFSSPASNINTNISNGGIGYFSCYSVTMAETIVKND